MVGLNEQHGQLSTLTDWALVKNPTIPKTDVRHGKMQSGFDTYITASFTLSQVRASQYWTRHCTQIWFLKWKNGLATFLVKASKGQNRNLQNKSAAAHCMLTQTAAGCNAVDSSCIALLVNTTHINIEFDVIDKTVCKYQRTRPRTYSIRWWFTTTMGQFYHYILSC